MREVNMIVMLSLARHDDVYTSTTFELATEFIKSNQVLVVEHPYTLTELLRGLIKRKGWLRLKACLSTRPVMKSKGNVSVLIPPAVVPTNFLANGKSYKKLQGWNHRMVSKRVNRFLLQENWGSYNYINSYNYHFPFLQNYLIGQQANRVYHCVDPIVKPYTVKHGLRNQEKAVESADIVISTAPQLQREWETKKPSFLVPNAVNYNHFSSPQKYVTKIRSLGNNIVGYFGVIERRIDYELLIHTFKANPDWTLIMAGPIDENFVPDEIKSMKNVHFTGKYTYAELPSLIYSVDVTIIPFRTDEASKSIYPLKLYEYMSTGKPIVCTQFNPDLLIPISDKVHIANRAEDLDDAIEKALKDKGVEGQLKRRLFASKNTWADRAQNFLNYLSKAADVQVEKSY